MKWLDVGFAVLFGNVDWFDMVKRRDVLKGMATLVGALLGSKAKAFNDGSSTALSINYEDLNALMKRFADELIPRDQAPSASDLGLDILLHKELGKSKEFMIWNIELAQWLDTFSRIHYQKSYMDMDDSQFSAAVDKLGGDSDNPVNRGFLFCRAFLMESYYSDKRVWSDLKGFHTPQPSGYPDHFKTLEASNEI